MALVAVAGTVYSLPHLLNQSAVLHRFCNTCLGIFDSMCANPIVDCVLAHSKKLAPLFYCPVDASARKNNIRPLVVSLLGLCSPSTIERFIIAINVLSVNRQIVLVPILLSPRNEPAKIMPLRTDGNTARSIILIFFALWVLAPLNHAYPNVV